MQAKLKLKACPRCRGDLALSYEMSGYNKVETWTCVQCGYSVEGEKTPIREMYTQEELESLMTT